MLSHACVQELEKVIEKTFDGKSPKVSRDQFDSNWDQVVSEHKAMLDPVSISILARAKEELDDLITHMPATRNADAVDWEKWKSEEGLFFERVVQSLFSSQSVDEFDRKLNSI